MITRHDSLRHALDRAESGNAGQVTTIVVSRRWWQEISSGERNEYRQRAKALGIALRADSQMTSHFVEMRGSDGPPLSSESHA